MTLISTKENFIRQFTPLNIYCLKYYNKCNNKTNAGGGTLAKLLKEGVSYIQRDVLDVLIEFSSFKDRVSKKFKELSRELEGKSNEHNLWVNLYLISTDYADEIIKKENRQQDNTTLPSQVQKIS